jgi:hypothetical protein
LVADSRVEHHREPDCPERQPPELSRGPQGGYDIIHQWMWMDSMILPQVHLRKPCYDFSFL